MICLLDEQKTITDKGGTMRLGAQPARLAPGSRAAACYGTPRHLRAASASLRVQQRLPPAVSSPRGMQVAGTSPDGALVEVVEIARPSRGSWACNIIPSSSRSRRGRTRCSPASSARRCVAMRPQSAVGGREGRGERGEGGENHDRFVIFRKYSWSRC